MSKSGAGTESQPHLYPTALPLSLGRPGTQQTACCPACSIPQAQVWANQELEPTAVDHSIKHVPVLVKYCCANLPALHCKPKIVLLHPLDSHDLCYLMNGNYLS